MQRTATFDRATPLAAGSVQVLVISVDAQLAIADASARPPSAEITRRAFPFTLVFMLSHPSLVGYVLSNLGCPRSRHNRTAVICAPRPPDCVARLRPRARGFIRRLTGVATVFAAKAHSHARSPMAIVRLGGTGDGQRRRRADRRSAMARRQRARSGRCLRPAAHHRRRVNRSRRWWWKGRTSRSSPTSAGPRTPP